jgi:hypothetical protein
MTALQRIVGRLRGERAAGLLLGLSAVTVSTACASTLEMGRTLDMGRTRVTEANPCLYVDFEPSGVVRLCGKEYAHWSGKSLATAGFPAFGLDGDYLVVKGRRTVKIEGSEIVAVTDHPAPDLRFHVTPSGDILDSSGKLHGTIRPVPTDFHVALVALAVLMDGMVVQAFTDVVSFGTRSPCSCQH